MGLRLYRFAVCLLQTEVGITPKDRRGGAEYAKGIGSFWQTLTIARRWRLRVVLESTISQYVCPQRCTEGVYGATPFCRRLGRLDYVRYNLGTAVSRYSRFPYAGKNNCYSYVRGRRKLGTKAFSPTRRMPTTYLAAKYSPGWGIT